MSHPVMFEEGDPLLARLRVAAARLPDVHEKVSHGRPVLTAGEKGKVFAVYGGGVKVRPGVHEPHDQAVLLKPDPAESGALAEDPRFFSPAYYGPAGWLGLDLDGGPAGNPVDWTEVGELLESSYRTVAGRRLLDRLDAAPRLGGTQGADPGPAADTLGT